MEEFKDSNMLKDSQYSRLKKVEKCQNILVLTASVAKPELL